MIAVTCAVKAVGGAVTGAVTAVTRGKSSSLAESPGLLPSPLQLATPEPLAHETLARTTEVTIALGGTNRRVRVSLPLLSPYRPHRYPRDLISPRTPCQSCRCGKPGPLGPP